MTGDQTFTAASDALLEKIRSLSDDGLIANLPALQQHFEACEALSGQEIAAARAKVAQTDAEISQAVIDGAVLQALRRTDVLPAYQDAAAALFLKVHRPALEVERLGGKYLCHVRVGRTRLQPEDAIEAWLESADLAPMRKPKEAPAHFAAKLRLIG